VFDCMYYYTKLLTKICYRKIALNQSSTCAVLQIGRSLIRFQMVSLEFFVDIVLPIDLWPWGRLIL